VISLFDNGSSPQVEPQSRGLVLALDHERKRATLVRAYPHRPPALAHALGSVQLQDNGNVLVGFGATPYSTEYSADGAVRLDLALPHGGENYRALRFPWVGRPLDTPTARLEPAGRLLYASWNGATEIARWRLETGPAAESLRAVLTAPKAGFETRLVLPANVAYAAAVALDTNGRPLGRSGVVRVA
jgi:hypothetical protein